MRKILFIPKIITAYVDMITSVVQLAIIMIGLVILGIVAQRMPPMLDSISSVIDILK